MNLIREDYFQKLDQWIYLPNEVSVRYEDDTFELIEMTEELFNRIAFNEYECG